MEIQHYFMFVGSIPMSFNRFKKLPVEIKLLEWITKRPHAQMTDGTRGQREYGYRHIFLTESI